MPSEWRETTLGELCEFRSGSVFPTEFQGETEGNLPFIKVSDMELPANRYRIEAANNWVSRERARLLKANIHPAGATAFAKIGVALTYNRRRLLVRDTVVDNNMMTAIPDPNWVASEFFYYLLTTLDFNDIVSGTALPYLTQRDLEGLPVSVPSIPVQQAIARILGALDDKIELNRKMNETLEQMARAVFKSWFVDFEPFRDSGMVESELGMIPEGWKISQLADLAVIQGGQQLPTEECRPAGPFPVFGANGIMGHAERATHDGFVIAFGRVGAYCGSVHWTYGGAWINNNASSVVPRLWPEFVLQTMLHADFEALRTGSAQPFIPNGSLASLQVIRGSDEILDEYCARVRPMRVKQHALQRESRTLAAIRDTLLPKLMSGEIAVSGYATG